jgi:hypothetical protein
MQVSQILSEIDSEIERLQQVRKLLADSMAGGRGRKGASSKFAKGAGKRRLSAEGRRKISEALKARWAERKRAAARKSK